MCSSHSLFSLSFLLAHVEESVKLTFLWQLIFAGDVIIFELPKGFWSLASFVTVSDCLKLLSFMWVFTVLVFCVMYAWASVLRSLYLAVKAISLML